MAPSSQRAFVVSIIVSGLIMGILVARVVAGVIAQFAEWRVVYYFAVGVQSVVLVACYAMVPDYPAKNADNLGYWGLIKSMVLFAVGEPQLIQVCLVIRDFCIALIVHCRLALLTYFPQRVCQTFGSH